MLITINQHEFKITWYKAIYALIITFFVFYIARDLAYNTAFVDEAIYATVGEEVLRKIFWEDAVSWMGGSYVYPVISATINHYFGLAGIRLFSMFCVLISAIISGRIARKLSGKLGELITLAVFLFLAITLNLAQIGTYDAPSLVCLALSFYFAIKSGDSTGKRKIDYLFLSSITAALAIVIKYIAVFIIPADIIVLITQRFQKNPDADIFDNIKSELHNIVIWLIPLILILSYYLLLYADKVIAFFVGGNSSQPDSRVNIINEIVNDLNILIVGLAVSMVIAFKSSNKYKKWFAYTLFLSGSIPLMYHLSSSNIRSLWKHLVFVSFFWVPVVSWPIVKLYKILKSEKDKHAAYYNLSQITLTILIIGIITGIWTNFSKHWRFQRSWPSATPVIEYLQVHRKPDDKIFAEASAIYKYHLFAGFEDPSSWTSTWYLNYKDELDIPAMKNAIKDKYFSFVILNHYYTTYTDSQIEPDLEKYYKVMLISNYKISGVYDNKTVVWAPK